MHELVYSYKTILRYTVNQHFTGVEFELSFYSTLGVLSFISSRVNSSKKANIYIKILV